MAIRCNKTAWYFSAEGEPQRKRLEGTGVQALLEKAGLCPVDGRELAGLSQSWLSSLGEQKQDNPLGHKRGAGGSADGRACGQAGGPGARSVSRATRSSQGHVLRPWLEHVSRGCCYTHTSDQPGSFQTSKRPPSSCSVPLAPLRRKLTIARTQNDSSLKEFVHCSEQVLRQGGGSGPFGHGF